MKQVWIKLLLIVLLAMIASGGSFTCFYSSNDNDNDHDRPSTRGN